jgi:Druantia protein DruA
METTQVVRCQGRSLTSADLQSLQELIDAHRDWSRHRVCVELCEQWDWCTPQGVPKTYAARELLLKLEGRIGLRLPPVQAQMRRRPWGMPKELPCLAPPPHRVTQKLQDLQPLVWELADYASESRLRALSYLRSYHYLGCDRPVGSHLLYLVKDQSGQDVAVHLIGAAAWQCADRDRFIGWSGAARSAHLGRIANHSRFLLLPWIEVKHLASHLLAQLPQRVAEDWPARHGLELALLESFVQTGRFGGTAYAAANWQRVGQTTGRTRQEKHHRAEQPPKAIWVYPLHPKFRSWLGAQASGGPAR